MGGSQFDHEGAQSLIRRERVLPRHLARVQGTFVSRVRHITVALESRTTALRCNSILFTGVSRREHCPPLFDAQFVLLHPPDPVRFGLRVRIGAGLTQINEAPRQCIALTLGRVHVLL